MRLRFAFAAVVSLALAVLATAAEPITGPSKLKAGTIGVYTVADEVTAFDVPAGLSIVERPGEWFLTGVPGTYTVKCAVLKVDWEKKKSSFRFVLLPVTIEGDIPPAPPPPPPGPDPPAPVPTPPTPGPGPGPMPVPPGKRFLLVVEETGESPLWRSLIRDSTVVQSKLKAGGHVMRWVDKDVTDKTGATPKDLAPYIERSRGKPLPRLFVVTQGGTVLFEGDLPSKDSEFVDILTKAGG